MTIAVAASVQAAPKSGSIRRYRKGVWALGDQGLISATNFATMVLVARGLTPAEFGLFTLVYSGLLFANSVQSALVTQPHNVLGTGRRRGNDYARYTTATAVSQLALGALAGVVSLVVGAIAYFNAWEAKNLLLVLAPSIVVWQLQEFVRRVLYTEGRYAAAFTNDVVSKGGQTAVVALLWWTGRLNGVSALCALAATSGVAAVLGAWQLRGSLTRRFDLGAIRENWNFGKWLAGAEILQWFASIQIYLYYVALILGTSATGTLKAAAIIFGPTRVLVYFLDSVLPIRFARALNSGGIEAMRRQVKTVYLLATPLLAGYCGLVALFAGPLLWLTYGERYAGSASVLALYALSVFPSYMTHVVFAALSARRRTQDIFRGYVWASTATVAVGWGFILTLGIQGTFVGLILTSVIMNAYLITAYRRDIARATDAGLPSGMEEQPCLT